MSDQEILSVFPTTPDELARFIQKTIGAILSYPPAAIEFALALSKINTSVLADSKAIFEKERNRLVVVTTYYEESLRATVAEDLSTVTLDVEENSTWVPFEAPDETIANLTKLVLSQVVDPSVPYYITTSAKIDELRDKMTEVLVERFGS